MTAIESQAATVELDGVRKTYEGGVVAVHGVDLTIAAGELVVLVGPSGCGKSTTLRMVAGLESITAGRLLINGALMNDVPPSERDIAMVFQSYALYPHMTVRENMGFALRLRKRPEAEIARNVEAAAATLGLTSMLDRRPRQLSGGQRQRVAIGRAIVREPSVFLFDEPLSNLDAALRSEMRRELAALHARLNATMLYVTHDQVEAMTLGDRIVVMHQGKVRQVDTPARVYERPADTFVAGFLGSPPMNLMPGRLVDRDGELRAQLAAAPEVELAVPFALAAPRPRGAEVIVGMRPEHFHTVGESDSQESFPAVVQLAEPLGHEQVLNLRLGDMPFAVRTAAGYRPAPGEVVHVRAVAAHVHLFDPATGTTLRAEGS